MPTTEIFVNNADNSMMIVDSAADPNSGGHAAARDGATATNQDSADAQSGNIIYERISKGGNTTIQVKRYFGFFDTSGITTEVTSATLSVYRVLGGGVDFIAVKSDAFGGDGGTAAAAADFNNLDFSTPYSSNTNIPASTGYQDITLNNTALADIQNNNVFIIALCQHANDFSDSDPGGNLSGQSLTINTGDNSTGPPRLTVTTVDSTLKLSSGLIKLTSGLIRIS